jgi:dTDP-4-amino-4,6-dideoxygalactose transaminase
MIRFCSPLVPDMRAVQRYLQPSFDAGHLSNFGQAYGKLCERLRTYLNLNDDKEVVIVSSGHAALQASYHVLNTKSPAVSDYTFASTMVASFGNPVVVDCDQNGFLDLEGVDGRCDGVALVCPISRIPDLQLYEIECKNRKVPLIIDGAATFGTSDIYNYGDCFCLSFHATKTFPIGEGGAVICSMDVAKKIKQYINFGLDDNKNIAMHGTNAKISEYSCAIGLSILDQIEQPLGPISRRIANARIYDEELSPYTLPSFSDETSYQTFPVYIGDNSLASTIRNKLRENNIEFSQYYRPLTGMQCSKSLYESNICLPCHHNVSEEQIRLICSIILS